VCVFLYIKNTHIGIVVIKHSVVKYSQRIKKQTLNYYCTRNVLFHSNVSVIDTYKDK